MSGCIHPGDFAITRQAFDFCGMPETASVLDIGCGQGETAGYIQKEYGMHVTGIDSAPEMIQRAKKAYPGLTFMEGNAQMLDFPSAAFTCVLMECSLSLVCDQQEAIHEAFCVLKDGGYLIIHDLYMPDPVQADWDALNQAKQMNRNRKHDGSDCGEGRVSECVVNGALLMRDIHAELEELGFETLLFEDKKRELDSFAASVIFTYGSFENYIEAQRGDMKSDPTGLSAADIKEKGRQSYFLLIARKRREKE